MKCPSFTWTPALVAFAAGLLLGVFGAVLSRVSFQRPRLRVHQAFHKTMWCIQLVQRPLGKDVTVTHLWYRGDRRREGWRLKHDDVELVPQQRSNWPAELAPGKKPWEWCAAVEYLELVGVPTGADLHHRVRARRATGWRDLHSWKRRRLRKEGGPVMITTLDMSSPGVTGIGPSASYRGDGPQP